MGLGGLVLLELGLMGGVAGGQDQLLALSSAGRCGFLIPAFLGLESKAGGALGNREAGMNRGWVGDDRLQKPLSEALTFLFLCLRGPTTGSPLLQEASWAFSSLEQ